MKKVTGIEARYLDCCLCDYFQGSSAEEVLAIPVFHDTTYKQAYDAAKDVAYDQSGFFDDIEDSGTMLDSAIHALFSGIEDVNAVADFVKYIEPVDDDDCAESVYLYIGLFAEYE